VIETIAGRANLLNEHPLNIGPVGVTGSDSANAIAEKADVIIAVGTRLQDFTTGSWTAFDKAAKLHPSMPPGTTRPSTCRCRWWATRNSGSRLWMRRLAATRHRRTGPLSRRLSARLGTPMCDNVAHGNRPNSYAQAIGVVNALCDPRDRVVTAAGGLPAEVTANWRTLDIGTVDVEFGFSCMGYEIAGGWGARIAQFEREPDKDTIVFVGDGSYLLMNSDIYSSVLSNRKLIILVLDNGGFAVINKLQNNTGNESFNNLIADCPTVAEPFAVDFEAHAAAMGATAETVSNPAELARPSSAPRQPQDPCHRDEGRCL
jgi:3D-(3,5/4)-trihydroxycyclohexane-1,2-dione acylhydrolase (decyclizing)